jgi:hypothetical protein
MFAGLAEHFHHEIGKSVDHKRLVAETFGRVDHAKHLDHARLLIEQGEQEFGRASMVEAVARRLHEDAVVEHYQASVNAARDVDEPYHAPGPEDRQRRNLAQFEDVGELVQAWRAGNLSWDYARWGPDPDSADCLLPWEAR